MPPAGRRVSPTLRSLLFVVALALVVAGLRAAYPVAMPLAAALIIVAAVWPIKQWLGRFVPGWVAYGGTVVALFLVSAMFVGSVWLSAARMVEALARNQARFNEIYGSLATWGRQHGIEDLGAGQTYAELLGLAQTVLTNIYTFLVYLGFILLLVILALPEVSRVHDRLGETIEREDRRDILAAVDQIAIKIRRYFGTTVLTSVLTGVASAAWSLAVGLELALVWGVLNFLLNFIPLVGNIIGIIPPTLYAVVQFQNVSMPVLVLLGFLVLQITISNFVYPALQGHSLALPPFVIVVALAFWGWMWDPAGALLAIPLTVACLIVADHFPATKWLARLLAR